MRESALIRSFSLTIIDTSFLINFVNELSAIYRDESMQQQQRQASTGDIINCEANGVFIASSGVDTGLDSDGMLRFSKCRYLQKFR